MFAFFRFSRGFYQAEKKIFIRVLGDIVTWGTNGGKKSEDLHNRYPPAQRNPRQLATMHLFSAAPSSLSTQTTATIEFVKHVPDIEERERKFNFQRKGFRTWFGDFRSAGEHIDCFVKEFTERSLVELARETLWIKKCMNKECGEVINSHFCLPRSIYIAKSFKRGPRSCGVEAVPVLEFDEEWIKDMMQSRKAPLNLYLLFPKIQGVDLVDYGTRQNEMGALPSRKVFREGFRQLRNGISFLHKNGLSHNDLSPENCMISWVMSSKTKELECRFIIIDMGTCDSKCSHELEPFVAKPHLKPPEWTAQSSYGDSTSLVRRRDLADLFALGFTLYVLMLYMPPWPTGKSALNVSREKSYKIITSRANEEKYYKKYGKSRKDRIRKVITCFWNASFSKETKRLNDEKDDAVPNLVVVADAGQAATASGTTCPFQDQDFDIMESLFSPDPLDRMKAMSM